MTTLQPVHCQQIITDLQQWTLTNTYDDGISSIQTPWWSGWTEWEDRKSSLSGTKHKNDNKNNAEKGNFQNVQSIYLFLWQRTECSDSFYMYQVKNKLLKMHSLFKSSKLSTTRLHVIMHRLLPLWQRDHGYGVSAFSPTPSLWERKGGRNEEWLLASKYMFSAPSLCTNLYQLLLFKFPSGVAPPIFDVSALHKPLTTCEWREQWWEHRPRKHPPSATWVCQSGNEYPPKKKKTNINNKPYMGMCHTSNQQQMPIRQWLINYVWTAFDSKLLTQPPCSLIQLIKCSRR